MTFFKLFLRILASTLATAAIALGPKLIAFFQGPAPSDISPVVWGVVGIAAVFAINFAVGKIPKPPTE